MNPSELREAILNTTLDNGTLEPNVLSEVEILSLLQSAKSKGKAE